MSQCSHSSQSSPIVPMEPQIFGVPVFHHGNSSLNFAMNQLTSRSLRRSTEAESCSRRQFSEASTCECPHILVADDDSFQGFFYETLLLRSINWEDILEGGESLQYELFPSGEELIQRWQRVKACGCGKTALIISDYSMQRNKMNGVETILALREKGYEGPVILRTSEDQDFLLRNHPEFLDLLNSGVISRYVKKQSFKEAKEVIPKLIKHFQLQL